MYVPWLQVCILFCSSISVRAIGQIIDAINAGGKAYEDNYGIQYRADPLEGSVGFSSDYGKRFLIGRVTADDQLLYQTERYNTESFEYTFPISGDGDYVLVLKFSEVYFNAAGQKIFDVAVNDHPVVTELDIFAKVGRGIAHDEYVPFSIRGGKLRILEEASDFDGTLTVQFIKGSNDNPKINALYIMRGTMSDVPQLPPVEQQEDEFQREEEIPDVIEKPKHASGPKQLDPYAQQDQGQMLLPILIALACFFPVLFCLCRL